MTDIKEITPYCTVHFRAAGSALVSDVQVLSGYHFRLTFMNATEGVIYNHDGSAMSPDRSHPFDIVRVEQPMKAAKNYLITAYAVV